jgi:DNA-binding transcriptional regulator YiaG
MKYHRPDAPPCDAPIQYRGAGLDGIYLCNGFTREEVDGEWFTHVEDIQGLHNAIALDLVAREGPLAPKEIRFIRNTMDKTQEEVAQAMGVDAQTVARWEKGRTDKMPGPADRMLRIMFIASMVGPELLLEYIREVQELRKKEAEAETRSAFTFARDPETKEWGKVPEDA